MNRRQILLRDIDGIPEEQYDKVKDFIDSMEDTLNNIANLLSNITYDKLDNITNAFEIASETGKSLY